MKRNIIYVVLTLLCLGVFFAYLWMAVQADDSVAPEILIDPAPLRVSVEDPESALLKGVTATDDRDGDVTESLVVEKITLSNDQGLMTVGYAAFDRAGNVTKAQREVQYVDYTGPRFQLSQALVFTENSGFDVLRVVTAQDPMDGDITQWIRATTLEEQTVAGVGNHTVQFRVSNSLGDTAILELPVEVHPAGAFYGDLKLKDYLVYLKVGDPFDETDYLLSYTLGNRTLEFKQKLPDQFRLEVDNQVDMQNPGVYPVTYRLIYTEGGYSYTGYSRLLVVVEG